MKITVIVSSAQYSIGMIQHLNERVPIPKRAVQIELTADQVAAIGLKCDQAGKPYEEVFECWIEDEQKADA